jgi:Domain of unknown function (DUF4307)
VSTTAPDLAERYGAPSRRTGPALLALMAVLVLAGGAWLVWAVAGGGRPAVSSQMVGFRVRGEHAVTATFTVVRRDPHARVTCMVRALADDHAVVGEASVPVRSGAATRQVSTTVRTERRATSVDLVDCRVPTG